MSPEERTKAMHNILNAVKELSIYEGVGVLDCAKMLLYSTKEKEGQKFFEDYLKKGK